MATNIVRYDPFEELNRLQRDMSRLFDENLGMGPSAPARSGQETGGRGGVGARGWMPAVDVREDANEFLIHAELPGVKQDDIDIEVTGDTLTLRGERKFEETTGGGDATGKKQSLVRVERAYGSFARTFTLGVPIDNDKVSASFQDGVLTIHVPKSESLKPRKVQLTGS